MGKKRKKKKTASDVRGSFSIKYSPKIKVTDNCDIKAALKESEKKFDELIQKYLDSRGQLKF